MTFKSSPIISDTLFSKITANDVEMMTTEFWDLTY